MVMLKFFTANVEVKRISKELCGDSNVNLLEESTSSNVAGEMREESLHTT
jgi:hypothetical protein